MEWCGALFSLVKEAAEDNLNLVIDIKREITKFDTVLLHSNWSSLGRKYWRKISTDVNVLSCGPKASSILEISVAISPCTLHPRTSSQRVRSRTVHDEAICSKNRRNVPCYGDPILEVERLRSPFPIMAPDWAYSTSPRINMSFQRAKNIRGLKIWVRDWVRERLFNSSFQASHITTHTYLILWATLSAQNQHEELGIWKRHWFENRKSYS